MSPEFLLTAFIVCLAPGVGIIYTLSTVLGRGLTAAGQRDRRRRRSGRLGRARGMPRWLGRRRRGRFGRRGLR